MKAKTRDAVSEFLEKAQTYKKMLIIVEGVNDKKTLKALGFTNIIYLRTPLYKIAECVVDKEVVILTDLDLHGKKLYSRLKSDLSQRGVYVDDTLRNLLFKTELRQVEGLANYIERRLTTPPLKKRLLRINED